MAGLEVTPASPSSWISLSRPPARRKSRERKSSQTDWPRSRNSSRGFCAMISPERDLCLGRFGNVLRREAELLHKVVGRRRSAESAHPDGSTLRADVPLPADRGGSLDRHPRPDRRRQHLVSIARLLPVEQLP